MELHLDQRIAAPRAQVLEALVDPDFYASVGSVNNVAAPEVLQISVQGSTAQLEVRYGFSGELSGPAKAALDAAKLTWVIHTTLDLEAATASLEVVPDHYQDLLSCSGGYDLLLEGEATLEQVDATLEVHFPFVARAAEQAIARGFEAHLAAEAAALERFCRR